jgi:hypothetical protein
MTIAEWSRFLNKKQSTINDRLSKGWKIKEALLTEHYGRK